MKIGHFFRSKFTLKRFVILIVILIAIFTGYNFTQGTKTDTAQFVKVQTGAVKSVISAAGTLVGKETANLKFKSGGKLAYISVRTGDTVTKGQAIAGLDTQELQISLQQTYNDFIAKDATAKRVEDDLKDHDDDETFTQKETRIKAQTARDSAYDDLKAAQLAISNSHLIAPISGVITQAEVLPNQIVAITDTVAQIVDWSQVYFDAEIDESDISRIELNQEAEVTFNSYPDQIFTGTITEITPQTKTASNGATVVIVRILLANPPTKLIFGLNGEASIILDRADDTLLIPEEALLEDNTVLVKEGADYKNIPVQTGIRSDLNVEILEGLESGQEIVANPGEVKK